MLNRQNILNRNTIYFVFLFSLITPWLILDSQALLKYDVSWLILSAQRFLDGQTMAEGFYETNPPLIIILFSIPAYFAEITNIPIYYLPFFFCLAGSIFFTALFNKLLSYKDEISNDLKLFLTGSVFIGYNIIVGYDIGQREQLIAFGLIPMVLYQYFASQKIYIPKSLALLCCVFGTLLVLLKPHYGIAPATLIVYRMIRDKGLFFYKYPEFWALGGMAALYILICFVYFPDYIFDIMPRVIEFYVPYSKAPQVTFMLSILVILPCIVSCTYLTSTNYRRDRSHLQLMIFFFSMAILCLIPPIVQMKGFSYHYIPSFIFVFLGLSTHTYVIVVDLSKKNPKSALYLTTVIIMTAAYSWHMPNPNYPTHQSYNSLSFSKALEKYSDHGAYMVLWENTGFTFLPAIYSHYDYASRFPRLFFYEAFALEKHKKSDNIHEDGEYFRRMIVQDFNKYKPFLVTLPVPNGYWPESYHNYEPLDFLLQSKDFSKIWESYEFRETITIKKSEYYNAIESGDPFSSTQYKIYTLK